jgi:hypothetical protein
VLLSSKNCYISRISQRSFLTISSAFVGLTFRVNSFLGVRSFSLTSRSSRLMLQYSARSAIAMNSSTSKISTGTFFALAGSYRAASSILSFVVPAKNNVSLVCVQDICKPESGCYVGFRSALSRVFSVRFGVESKFAYR